MTTSLTFPAPLYDAALIHPYPLLFATVSGAHLYGFPSPDSDWDLRGVHLLPAQEVLGLHKLRETIGNERVVDGLELDLVTHDARKFMTLMLKPNGYVLEQLHSPLVVKTTPEHEELISLGRRCVTRFHAHHYLGFSAGQWKLLNRDDLPRIKPLLYTLLPYLDELMAQKRAGREKEPLQGDLAFYEAEFRRLTGELEEAREGTHLPAKVGVGVEEALSDLLVRLRMEKHDDR